jgi:hypothetical protein
MMPFMIWLPGSSDLHSSIAARARLTVLLPARNLVWAHMIGKNPLSDIRRLHKPLCPCRRRVQLAIEHYWYVLVGCVLGTPPYLP